MKLSNIHLLLGEQRRNRNLSQKDIADALNVEQSAVSFYENGKRGIPLDILDEWLKLLEIELKIIPKGCEPVKPAEEIESDLEKAGELRKRRNYLIAEMRAVMAEQIAAVPEFQRTAEDSGEPVFWKYSFYGNPFVGLVETRYDHPKQKYLAVEYAEEGVNVYKFLGSEKTEDWEATRANHFYFSEDDFLTFGGRWEPEDMEMRGVPILRAGGKQQEGYELVCSEGFSLSSLLEMQENHKRLAEVYKAVESDWAYRKMDHELNEVEEQFCSILSENRLQNGAMNTDFPVWTEQDRMAIDVPLWAEQRNWSWIEEGVEWVEEFQEMEEIRLTEETDNHEDFYVHRDEEGNRVIGLIGTECEPAVFKSNPRRLGAMYRVKVELDELTATEQEAYFAVLAATKELEIMRTEGDFVAGLEPIEDNLSKKTSLE